MATHSPVKSSQSEMINTLVQNNLLLQQKNVELIVAMQQLTHRIDTMVGIFSKAAQHIERGDIKEPLANKLTDLLEQNKKIASGLLLLERYIQEKRPFTAPKSEKEITF